MTDYTVEIDPTTPAGYGEETFVLVRDAERRTMRLHDYEDIYAVPGLYEHVIYERLGCRSPQTLAAALAGRVDADGVVRADVRCLDVGAGNGVSGAALHAARFTPVVGLDASAAAHAAVERDRPGLYEQYVVARLDDVDAGDLVSDHRLNALVSAGALTGGHIDPDVLAATWAAFAPGDRLAFTCPEQHADAARADFGSTTDFEVDERFEHRKRTDGTSVHYRVLVGRHT